MAEQHQEAERKRLGDRFDLLDLIGVLGAFVFVAGLFIWFGPGPALTVLGLFLVGLALVIGMLSDKAKSKAGG